MKTPAERLKFDIFGLFCYFIFLFSANLLSGQTSLVSPPNISVSATSGCNTTLNTTISNYVGNETSAELFYRLDGRDLTGQSLGSYFWHEPIVSPNLSKITTLTLPTGFYDVVCYATRKGGPIKTNQVASFSINDNTCTSPMPDVFPLVLVTPNVDSMRVMLSASWNVFTDSYYSNDVNSHFVNPQNPASTNLTPWLFVTLSVENWAMFQGDAIKVYFEDAFFDYVGAIADNDYNNLTNKWKFVQNPTPSTNYVELKRTTGIPANRETHIHLIFKNKTGVNFTGKRKALFTAEYKKSLVSQTTTTEPLVSGTPHDPNSLVVDKKTLCPCQKEEWLTYQVNFQNKGSAPASAVTVELLDYAGLDINSIELLNRQNQNTPAKTFMKTATVKYDYHSTFNPNVKKFIISDSNPNYDLPGTEQLPTALHPYEIDVWETMDYFKFKIRKDDCLDSGKKIKPKGAIIFYNNSVSPMGTVVTKLEETTILPAGTENCREPDVTCTACNQNKPCWLVQLFKKKKKKK